MNYSDVASYRGGDFSFASVLREPGQRLASLYDYVRR
eukprot:SAG11_NODE_18996_length_476_cov_0.941645_1_plen_36_part_10